MDDEIQKELVEKLEKKVQQKTGLEE